MWICKNCDNQNEENFKFCWSCGRPRSNEIETREETPKMEFKKELEMGEPQIIRLEPIEFKPKKKKVKPEKSQKNRPERREPELFSAFIPESGRSDFSTESESDWERIIFATAVRLIGLYFIFLVLLSIPDFVAVIYSFILDGTVQVKSLRDLFAISLFTASIKILFYLILGIYLISSGRFFLRMLPRK